MLSFQTITSLEEAKTYWQLLSPKEEIYDEWLFRYLYYKYLNCPIHFIVGFDGKEAIGLLPLQWNAQENYLEFFGGRFMSYNTIFVKKGYEYVQIQLVEQLQKPAYLRWLRHPIAHPSLTTITPTYYLPLRGLKDTDNYLDKYWHGKSKNEFKRQTKRLLETNIEITYNNFADFDHLVEFNKQKWGQESVFYNPYRSEFFKDVIQNFECHLISIKIDGQLSAVAFRIGYKGILYGINAGLKEGSKNLGKFIYLKTIELGINLNKEKYDALEGSYNWKEDFGFQARQQYSLDLRAQ